MKVGITIAANDFTNRRRSLAQMVDSAVRAEELGYDSVWVMDHIFIDRGTHVVDPGPDPLILLGQIAARTSRVELGTLVLCAPFRPPAQLAREAKALAEASQERFILGMGSGWHQPEFDAYGFPYDHRVSRFEEHMEVLTRLVGAGRSTYRGTYQQLLDGEVFGMPMSRPWVAASQPRMLAITARLADGWNTAWHTADPALFEERLSLLVNALSSAGRPRSSMIVSAGLMVLPVSGAETEAVARRLARGNLAEAAIVGNVDEVVAAIAVYREEGCDHAILNFSASPFVELDPDYAARLAPALPQLRG